jgi:hypothetical protein
MGLSVCIFSAFVFVSVTVCPSEKVYLQSNYKYTGRNVTTVTVTVTYRGEEMLFLGQLGDLNDTMLV